MITVARLDDGRALLIYDPSQIPPGEPTMEVETIPPGEGLLMTDLSSLWWEEVPPQPEPGPEPEPEEDPYAEMAKAIREGVNEV